MSLIFDSNFDEVGKDGSSSISLTYESSLDKIIELPKILLGTHSIIVSVVISLVMSILSTIAEKNLPALSTVRQFILPLPVSFPTEIILKGVTSTSVSDPENCSTVPSSP